MKIADNLVKSPLSTTPGHRRWALSPKWTVEIAKVRLAPIGTTLAASGYAVLFTFLAFRRYVTFGTLAFDLGNMDQAVWNTIHGRLLAFSNMDGVTTRLAIHVEPTLILISPIYLLWSDPRALLLLQTVALATGTLPVYRLARREIGSEAAAFFLAAGYLLFPSLEAVNYAEFHPVALSAPLLLWAFYFAQTDHWIGYAVTSLLAMGTKEEVGLVVAVMGIYLAVRKRSTWPAVMAVVGGTWSLIAVFEIIDRFNPSHSSPYEGYYEYLGSNLPSAVVDLMLHPWVIVEKVASEPDYVASLLLPNAFLALLSPARLVIGLPSFMINVLSENVAMHRPNLYHYTAPLIPAAVLATIGGVNRAKGILERFGLSHNKAISLVIVVYMASVLLYQRADGLTPLARGFSVPSITEHDRIGYEVIAQVPKDASLSVQSELNSHLSERQKLYVFPDVGDAEYVLVDRFRDPGSPDPVNDPTQMQLHRLDILQQLLRSGKFTVLIDRDGYMLLKRKG